MNEPRLVQVQVLVQFARDEDGEIGELFKPIVFTVSAADWKRGWDWRAEFERVLETREVQEMMGGATQAAIPDTSPLAE